MILLGFAAFLPGCAAQPHQSNPDVSNANYTRMGDWKWKDLKGQTIQTAHYQIHTTVTNPEILSHFTIVMEQAYLQYQKVFPCPVTDTKPLEILYFAQYDQWAAYTIIATHEDAKTYLSVFNGAYCIGDQFVCWEGNHADTLQTAAHEGFHQYVCRYFKTRLPPSLEEGIASTFENITIDGTVAIIDTTRNPRRENALRYYMDKPILPLEKLLQIHAGQLADRSPEMSELYYAQAWALARMLQTSPKYQAGYNKMISDIAFGKVANPIGMNDGTQVYLPDRILPTFKTYFGEDFAEFLHEYEQYFRLIGSKNAADHE